MCHPGTLILQRLLFEDSGFPQTSYHQGKCGISPWSTDWSKVNEQNPARNITNSVGSWKLLYTTITRLVSIGNAEHQRILRIRGIYKYTLFTQNTDICHRHLRKDDYYGMVNHKVLLSPYSSSESFFLMGNTARRCLYKLIVTRDFCPYAVKRANACRKSSAN